MERPRSASQPPRLQTEDTTEDSFPWPIVIGVIVAAVVVVVVLVCVVRKFCCNKKASTPPAKAFDQVDSSLAFQLSTLGNHYKKSSFSIQNEKHLSVEAKCAQARAKSGNLSSDQQFEKNGETFPEAEKLMAAETEASKVDSKACFNSTEPCLDPARKVSDPTRTRLDSTYLDVSVPCTRRSSHSSQHLAMDDLENQTAGNFKVNRTAPHASEASLTSTSSSSSCRSSNPRPLTIFEDARPPIIPKASRLRSPSRPSSEGMFEEAIPKLPKKKFAKATGSAFNVRSNAYQTKAAASSAKKVSKSANCLMDDDDDYDDLPPTSRLPPTSPLPPKLRARPARPALPPKQKINKSSEVLQQIDNSFKKSLTELKLNKARDAADATDSDYEEPTPAFRSVHNVTIDRNVSVVDNANNDDDDYDEPPEEVSSKVPAHEFEDYDEPIHHSSFASAGKF